MANEADSGGSDLGRRMAAQRSQAGLTVAKAAERAGMSPEYLTYLESSSSPNPTQATLMRLAAALDARPGSLSGAGMYMPPGQRGAAKNPVLEDLTADQSRAHIAGGGVGRFLFVDADRGPVAEPVNYRMDGADVVFRTDSKSSILTGVQEPRVSFDVDHIDDALSEGWSVLLSGTASVVTDPAELARVKALGIEPWPGGQRDTYIRFSISQISGRRIRVTG